VKIAAIHGWAGGGFIWEKLQEKLPGIWTLYNRGYFDSVVPKIDMPLDADLILYHSMGPLFISPDLFDENVPVVYLNGFDTFTGTDGGYQRIALRNLARLKAAVNQDAENAITSFYRGGGAEIPVSVKNWNTAALEADLVLLERHPALESAFGDRQLLTIFAENDPVAGIVTRKLLQERANRVIFVPTGSHFLPLTHADTVAESIFSWLKERRF
jgi:pimeloyl-ACP methyl ester carboxylesterase